MLTTAIVLGCDKYAGRHTLRGKTSCSATKMTENQFLVQLRGCCYFEAQPTKQGSNHVQQLQTGLFCNQSYRQACNCFLSLHRTSFHVRGGKKIHLKIQSTGKCLPEISTSKIQLPQTYLKTFALFLITLVCAETNSVTVERLVTKS